MFDESDLLRFLEGDCSPEEAAAIQAWIAAEPARGELLDELRGIWGLTGGMTRPWDIAAARERLRRVRERASARRVSALRFSPRAGRPVRRAPRPQATPRSMRRAPWVALAAAAIVLLIVGVGIRYVLPYAATPQEFATAPGQRLALRLSDGSQVWLSVDTELRVPRDYGVGNRVVELDGEGFFTVRHDPGRPFLVRTVHGTAVALGTEFDVRAYRDDGYLQVVVATGRVALRASTPRTDSVLLTLHPRDLGVLDARGVATLTPDVPLERYLAWRRGGLTFDDTPLRDAIVQLERWYDLVIRTSDRSLDDARITITFTSESADEALSALAKVLDARYTRADRVVRLAPADSR